MRAMAASIDRAIARAVKCFVRHRVPREVRLRADHGSCVARRAVEQAAGRNPFGCGTNAHGECVREWRAPCSFFDRLERLPEAFEAVGGAWRLPFLFSRARIA
jgi:hypothetical protein